MVVVYGEMTVVGVVGSSALVLDAALRTDDAVSGSGTLDGAVVVEV